MTTEALVDGVYYDMPEAIYHSLPRLSASGVRNLLVSPMTFWSRSWLNTAPKDDDEKENKFRLKGRAYHARIVEGAEQFHQRFAYALDPRDYPTAMTKGDEYKSWCQDRGLKTTKLKVDEIKELIRSQRQGALIWDDLVEAHAKFHAGKTIIPNDWMIDIERGAAIVEKHPTIGACFRGGAAEVTILWTHQAEASDGSGELIRVPMKSRIDRLKAAAIVDFKTYGNHLDMPPARAIAREIAAHRYHVQAAIYYKAVDHAVAQGWIKPCNGNADGDGRPFTFVFQGTGDDPSPLARTMGRELMLVDIGRRQFEAAAETFARYTASHGGDPWITDSEIETLTNEDFPAWAGE